MSIKIKPLPFIRIFLIIYSIVNVIGFINFPFYKNTYNNSKLVFIFIIGFLGLLLGKLASQFIHIKKKKQKGSFKKVRFIMYIFIINIMSILSIIFLNYKNGHIILFQNSSRFASYFIINVFVYAIIILYISYFSNLLLENKPISKKNIFFIILQSFFVISMGYRSPLIILFGCVGVVFLVIKNNYQNKYKKIFTVRNMIIFLIFIYIMTSISSYRRSQKYSFRKYYRNINMNYIDKRPLLKAYVPTISLLRYNQLVVYQLIKKTENKHLKGKLFLSNFVVLLPGTHLSARNIIGKILGKRKMPNGKPWSITPTLQGALYVDGGYILVFIGFFIISLILSIYEKIIILNPTPFNLTIYSFLFISFLMSIHTGYLDFMFYLLLLV